MTSTERKHELLSEAEYQNLELLWNYMQLHAPPRKADCIVGLGCYNEDIPRQAARLYHAGYAPVVLFSGGLGRNTKSMWQGSEAERFARIAVSEGIPAERILLETKSTNTAENILFTKELLEANGIRPQHLLVVHKPYMQRRVAAAWPVYWPNCPITLSSWPQTLPQYLSAPGGTAHTPAFTANMIVGDFQRIALYAQKGYQLPQEIPPAVQEAFEALIAAGFTEQLVK